MEVASNLVWLLLSVAGLAMLCRHGQWRDGRLSLRQTLLGAAVLAFVLLPTLSLSDDYLEAQQSALPVAAQTWHLASENGSHALECAPILLACALLLQDDDAGPVRHPEAAERGICRHAAWLTRSQRLRPPPSVTA